MKTVTFYTRADCHLCHEALAIVERVRAEQPFTLLLLDLDREASAEKRAAYDWDVPVVEVDGKKLFKHHVDAGRLLRHLRE